MYEPRAVVFFIRTLSNLSNRAHKKYRAQLITENGNDHQG